MKISSPKAINWTLKQYGYKQHKDPAAFFGICYENLVQICTKMHF
jgi:hypothetical protein